MWTWERVGEKEGGAVRGELGKRGSEEEAEGAEGRESGGPRGRSEPP